MSRRRILALVVIFGLLASAAGFGYRWLTSSTPVSFQKAITEYRQEVKVGLRSLAQASADTTRVGAEETVPNRSGESAKHHPTREDLGTPSIDARSADINIRFPEPGVYTWRTRGFEETTPGVRRAFPPESRRVVSHRENVGWTSRHMYSDQHDEWLDLALTGRGVIILAYQLRINFGPFKSERARTYDPPILGVPSPTGLEETWQGSWSDGAGTYEGRTFQHTTMRIGDKDIEVWGNELAVKIRGDEHGEATFRFWWSPRHMMTVKEEGNITMHRGSRTYHRESLITMVSTEPNR